MTWTSNLAEGIVDGRPDNSPELLSIDMKSYKSRQWTKSVEHIAVQATGFQNKYIWAEVVGSSSASLQSPVVENASLDVLDNTSAAFLQRERKHCGHWCFPSSTNGCCACMDQRPILKANCYPSYRDGEGWVNCDSRDAGYCPVCNPKNFEEWNRRIKLEHEEKERLKRMISEQREKQRQIEEQDKLRAAATV